MICAVTILLIAEAFEMLFGCLSFRESPVR